MQIGQVIGESTLAPSLSAREGEAIDSLKLIGSAYRPSYPQVVHRFRPKLSTIGLWTAVFVVLLGPETVISFDIMNLVSQTFCQLRVSVQ